MRLLLHLYLHLLILNDVLQLRLVLLLAGHQRLLLEQHAREQVVLLGDLQALRLLHVLNLFVEYLEVLASLML